MFVEQLSLAVLSNLEKTLNPIRPLVRLFNISSYNISGYFLLRQMLFSLLIGMPHCD